MHIPNTPYGSHITEFTRLCPTEDIGSGARSKENKAGFHAGLPRNIYCVSIDAVIAASQTGMRWKPLAAGLTGERKLDTRAAASDCRFVTCAPPEIRSC